MKSKLTRLIRFFAFQVIMLLFALHVSGQSINGIEGTPTCPNCYNTSVIPSRVASTLGISTVANDSAAFASGKGSIASGMYSTAFGYYSRALKHSSFAAGYRAKADSAYSVGLGYYSEAVNHYTFSFGKYVKASALNSMVIGKGYDSNSQFLNDTIPNSIMLGMGSTNPTVTIRGATTGTGCGKVGIGTSNPNEKLEIDGFVRTSEGYKVGTTQVINSARDYNGTSGTFTGILCVTGTGNSTFAGNVGIGTTSPGSQLDITGTFTARTSANVGNTYSKLSIGKANSPALSYGTSYIGFNAERTSDNNWTVLTDNAHNGGAVIYGTINGDLVFSCIKTNGTTNRTLTDSQIKENAQMKLTMDGILKTKEVVVALDIWSDIVFADDYPLPKLSEVESYIKQNNHLPDVPSEAEVMENGIRVGEMNALLLKKVEELTLYVIEQQKMLECQHTEIENLKQLFTSKNNQ